MVQSVTKNKEIQWKSITDVMKHDVIQKTQHKIIIENDKSCTVTEDHSLFMNNEKTIQNIKTKDLKINDNLAYIENGQVISKKIISNLIINY